MRDTSCEAAVLSHCVPRLHGSQLMNILLSSVYDLLCWVMAEFGRMSKGEKSFKTLLTKEDVSFLTPACREVEAWNREEEHVRPESSYPATLESICLPPSLRRPWEGWWLTS